MSIPLPGGAVPAEVRELAPGADLVAVWENGLGGLTFRATDAAGIRYVKYGPRNPETTCEGEAERLRWAVGYTPVPRVISAGGNDTHEWLITAALPGESAVAPRWVADPRAAVRAVGAGLRALHDTLPVTECPFRWDVPSRLARAAERGVTVPAELHTEPPVDRLVVCHGDACAPNTLVAEDGAWAGHVDLGALGVGDRWADIAVAAMSTLWNYGPGWGGELLDAYGIRPDHDRMRYYRDLWNAT